MHNKYNTEDGTILKLSLNNNDYLQYISTINCQLLELCTILITLHNLRKEHYNSTITVGIHTGKFVS